MTMRVVPQFNLSVTHNFSVVDLSSADSYLDFLLTPDHMHGGSIYHASLWVSPTNNGIGTRRMRVVRATQPRSDTFAAAMAVHAGQVQADFLQDELYPLPPSYSTSGASHHMLPYGDLYADDYEPSEGHRRSMCTYTAGADYMEAEVSIPANSQSLLQLRGQRNGSREREAGLLVGRWARVLEDSQLLRIRTLPGECELAHRLHLGAVLLVGDVAGGDVGRQGTDQHPEEEGAHRHGENAYAIS